MSPVDQSEPLERTSREQSTSKKPFVSIVVPAYNEGAILENNLNIISDYMVSLEDDYQWELIVVNDGSTDDTGSIADACSSKRHNIKVLHHMYNFRLGQALRHAFNNCHGDYVVVLDADLNYSTDHIGMLLAKAKETKAKIVIASPYMKGGRVSNVPWLRKTLSVCANKFLAFFARDRFQGKLTTLTGMVRAYDRQFLSRLNLKAMDMDINPEIIYKAMILRARVVEIPAHLNWNPEEAAEMQGMKRISSIRVMRNILSSLLSGFIFRPFMFFIIPGTIIFLFSLYPIAWAFVHTITMYGKVSGKTGYTFSAAVSKAFELSPHSFIVGGITLMISVQLVCFGIISMQNKRYFEELFHLGSNLNP